MSSTQHPQDKSSGDTAGGMPAGVEQSGQQEEDTMKQAELPLRQSLEDLVVVKDLDTGRAINVLKKYTIRDLNTGQLFVVDAEPSAAPEARSEPGSPKVVSKLVTDVSSGREMSMEEFDRALGLHTALEAARKKFREDGFTRSVSGSSEGSGPVRPGENGGKNKKKSASDWLKQRFFSSGKSRLGPPRSGSGGMESDDSTVSNSPSHTLDRPSFNRLDSGPASPSGRGPDKPVKVLTHTKLVKELTHLVVIQELNAHNGVIWTMKFSKNGKYLASAGQDTAVRVWEVCLKRGETENAEEEARGTTNGDSGDEVASTSAPDLDCPVLRVVPYRTFAGHTADVLDLAWSKSQFLLTASMDKTVRLWHISMDDCLRVFKHTDFVTSLDFHPVDDKYFISGSIDGKVRVWNIPEQRVVDWADVHEMVTATAFAPDGRRAVVGTMKGRCRFYQCEPSFKLEYQAQIDVKNRRGNTSRGRKITGMQFMPKDSSQLLITSNDSRVRLYDGFTMRTKYKGHHNRNTQIRGTFSADGAFLICGSDDGWVYVWTTGGEDEKAPKQEKSASYECFHAHNDIVTVALFAPKTARRVHRIPSRGSNAPAKAGVVDHLNRLGLRGKWSKEQEVDAAHAAEAAVRSERALGQVILTAGYNGEIKVFENLGAPQWLQ
ncbi:g4104 [Coccomyxa elongata]